MFTKEKYGGAKFAVSASLLILFILVKSHLKYNLKKEVVIPYLIFFNPEYGSHVHGERFRK